MICSQPSTAEDALDLWRRADAGLGLGLGGEAEGGVASPMMYGPDAVHND